MQITQLEHVYKIALEEIMILMQNRQQDFVLKFVLEVLLCKIQLAHVNQYAKLGLPILKLNFV